MNAYIVINFIFIRKLYLLKSKIIQNILYTMKFTCIRKLYHVIIKLRVNFVLLTATSNVSVLFLTYQPRIFSSFFTLFSHPISFLPRFLLETYKPTTSPHECNSLFIVINSWSFCPFLLIHSYSIYVFQHHTS